MPEPRDCRGTHVFVVLRKVSKVDYRSQATTTPSPIQPHASHQTQNSRSSNRTFKPLSLFPFPSSPLQIIQLVFQQMVLAALVAQVVAEAFAFGLQKGAVARVGLVGAARVQRPVLARFDVVHVDADAVPAGAERVGVEAHGWWWVGLVGGWWLVWVVGGWYLVVGILW